MHTTPPSARATRCTGTCCLTLVMPHRSAEAAGVRDAVRFQLADCADWTPQRPPTMCVVNPPWGSRLLNPTDNIWEGDGPASSAASGQLAHGSQPAPLGEELQTAWQSLRTFFKVDHCDI